MSIWTLSLIPCTYNGLFCPVRRTAGRKHFKLAKHGAVGRDGEFIEPLGAESRVIPLTVEFPAAYFEAHKLLTLQLDLTQTPLVPGVLSHPVWGIIPVYCEDYDAQIDFEKKTAVIECTFRRHSPIPEPIMPIGAMLVPVPDMDLPSASLGAYLAFLAVALIFQSAFLAGLLALARLAGSANEIADRSLSAAGTAFFNWTVNFFYNDFSTEDPPHDQVESRFDNADRIEERFRQAMKLPGHIYAAATAGAGGYDPGVYSDGRAVADRVNPRVRAQAALVICAVWRGVGALVVAGRLADAIARAERERVLDVASADAAIIAMRRRFQTAARLIASVMPYHAGPWLGEISRVADGLTRQMAAVRRRSRGVFTRTHVTDGEPRPLAVIALELLGDATRAEDIRRLNPDIRVDFNRLPRGTELKVPA